MKFYACYDCCEFSMVPKNCPHCNSELIPEETDDGCTDELREEQCVFAGRRTEHYIVYCRMCGEYTLIDLTLHAAMDIAEIGMCPKCFHHDTLEVAERVLPF